MKYHTHFDVFRGVYVLTLLGGEFDNCHGEGKTVEAAEMSLKFRINWLRRK